MVVVEDGDRSRRIRGVRRDRRVQPGQRCRVDEPTDSTRRCVTGSASRASKRRHRCGAVTRADEHRSVRPSRRVREHLEEAAHDHLVVDVASSGTHCSMRPPSASRRAPAPSTRSTTPFPRRRHRLDDVGGDDVVAVVGDQEVVAAVVDPNVDVRGRRRLRLVSPAGPGPPTTSA